MHEIFAKEFKDCLSSLVITDYGDLNGLLANAVYVCLKINKVVKGMLAKGVKEHSCLQSAKINYVIERGLGSSGGLMSGSKRKAEDSETIEALRSEVTRLTSKVDEWKTWKKKLANIESMATSACQKLGLPLK